MTEVLHVFECVTDVNNLNTVYNTNYMKIMVKIHDTLDNRDVNNDLNNRGI